MLRKSSLSVAAAMLVIAACACGNYANQQPPVAVKVLRSIAVTPGGAQLELGMNQQFTAVGTFSDGTTQDVTASASWSSSDQNVLRVNTAAGRVGLGNTRGAGTA